MYLKSPDPTAHAVIHGGRLYPVVQGIFQVPDGTEGFDGYQEATEIPAGVAAELADAGSHEHVTEEPAQAVQEEASTGTYSSFDEHVQQLTDELKSTIAEKDALADRVKELVDAAEKPFEVVQSDIEGLVVEVDHEARKIVVRLEGHSEKPLETAEADVAELGKLAREELNKLAVAAGIEHPEKLANKQAVVDAIAEAKKTAAE